MKTLMAIANMQSVKMNTVMNAFAVAMWIVFTKIGTPAWRTFEEAAVTVCTCPTIISWTFEITVRASRGEENSAKDRDSSLLSNGLSLRFTRPIADPAVASARWPPVRCRMRLIEFCNVDEDIRPMAHAKFKAKAL
jgi:hypothetical protein